MYKKEECSDSVINELVTYLLENSFFTEEEIYFVNNDWSIVDSKHISENSLLVLNCDERELNKNEALLVNLSESLEKFAIVLIPDLKPENHKKYFSSKGGFYGKIPSKLYSDKKDRFLYIGGYLASYKKSKNNLKVCAIISTYNEEDIVAQVCMNFINQGIYIHAIDNWSTDRTFSILKRLEKETDMVKVEIFPENPTLDFNWGEILQRKEEISYEDEYDWYIHTDADEIRESPWETSLLEGIQFVDSLDFNSINFVVLDFRPIKDGFSSNINPVDFFQYFELGGRSGHFLQVKAWKNIKGTRVNLVDSGGHVVSFEGKKVFPFKFLLRHYPLRSLAQMEKKIYKDRLTRFKLEKRTRGWHSQYDKYIGEKEVSLWNQKELLEFNKLSSEEYLLERLFTVNIEKE